MNKAPATTETATAQPETRTIVQPNGDLTDGYGRLIMDSFARNHLIAWIDRFEARNEEEAESTYYTIVNFLSRRDQSDLDHFLSGTWRDVLTNARFYEEGAGTRTPVQSVLVAEIKRLNHVIKVANETVCDALEGSMEAH